PRVHRLLRRARLWTLALCRRPDDDPAASPRERRVPALQLLHDLRSEDDARFADGADPLRGARCRDRLVRAVPAVPDERPAVVAGDLVDGRADPRSPVSGDAIRLDAPPRASDSNPGSRGPRRIAGRGKRRPE